MDTCATRYGAAGVLGNNDTSDLIEPLRRMGVRMLINEAFELRLGQDRLWIAGVDDPRDFRCDNLDEAVKSIPAGSFTVLLAHSPECIPDAARHGIALYLCGHTHGGQICLPSGSPLFANCSCPRRYTRGAWSLDALQGYTTTGAGTTAAPVRYNCPAEVAIIELRRG
jgi:predicted MPP superfamily phosphohydrolase